MAFSDYVSEIADELNLDTASAKTVRQIYSWANTVYRNVVNAEEYPWRNREVPLVTHAVGTGTAVFTKGASAVGTTAQSGLDGAAALMLHNFLRLDDDGGVYEIAAWGLLGGGQVAIALKDSIVHPTASYDFTVYFPRYSVGDVREDWVVGVYDQTQEKALTRVYPRNSIAYLQQAMINPSSPSFYFMEAAEDTDERGSLLSLSPSPNGAYSLTVKTLLGATTLTEDSSEIIIPSNSAPDIFKYGIGLLYHIKQKDKEGADLYGGWFNAALRDMITRAGKEPGMVNRITGYAIRDSHMRDRDVPKDWTW